MEVLPTTNNGNLLSVGTGSGAIYSFGYDAENRQTSLTHGGATTQFVYDGGGRRVQSIGPGGTVVYVYDAFGQLVADYGAPAGVPPCQTCYVSNLGMTESVDSNFAGFERIPRRKPQSVLRIVRAPQITAPCVSRRQLIADYWGQRCEEFRAHSSRNGREPPNLPAQCEIPPGSGPCVAQPVKIGYLYDFGNGWSMVYLPCPPLNSEPLCSYYAKGCFRGFSDLELIPATMSRLTWIA